MRIIERKRPSLSKEQQGQLVTLLSGSEFVSPYMAGLHKKEENPALAVVATTWHLKKQPGHFDLIFVVFNQNNESCRLDGIQLTLRQKTGNGFLERKGRLTKRGDIAIDKVPCNGETWILTCEKSA